MYKSVKHLSSTSALRLVAAIAVAAINPAFAASEAQPLDEISQSVHEFAMAAHANADGVTVHPSKLDRRLKLARCAEALDTFWAPGSGVVGNTTVGVRCHAPKPWKLYVPVRISKVTTVAVTARTLTRGHRIGPGDLRVEERDLAQLREDAVRDPATVQAYVVRQASGPGRVLSARMLAAPRLVERGQSVHLLTSVPGLSIRMSGVALDAGARGDTVRVRNPVSNRIVRAQVIQAGIVQMIAAIPVRR